MKTIQIPGGLLVAIAFLTGCFERSATTGPTASAAAASPAGVIGDRPYTWSLKCSGDYGSYANWSWNTGGVPIAGTSMSASCDPASSPISGSGTRPAAADGFSACVNLGDTNGKKYGTCKTWTFDQSTSFKTQLQGTSYYGDPRCIWFGKNDCKATGTLTVDS